MNLVRNKFEDLREIIDGNFDVLCVAETKTDSLFSTSQFSLEGYHLPYCLDASNKSGGLNASIPTRQLKYEIKSKDIQIISFEINLKKEKWLVVSIYPRLSHNIEYFMNAFNDIIDYFSRVYDNHLIIGNFILESNDSCMKSFLNSNSFTNWIETSTCFKGAESCTDTILTNRKYYFQYTGSNETGFKFK